MEITMEHLIGHALNFSLAVHVSFLIPVVIVMYVLFKRKRSIGDK